MIDFETIKYIELDKVIRQFCLMTGWTSTQGGIWNADFSKPVFDVKYPTNIDGHVLQGESKYAFLFRNPDEDLELYWKNLNKEIESISLFLKEKIYNHRRLGEVKYVEIDLVTIILWLMINNELEIEDALYHTEW
jgi:hypothetical protein